MATPPLQRRYLKELLNEEQEPFQHLTTTPSPPWTFPSRGSPHLALHVPPKTASLLLAAALRVHKHPIPPSDGPTKSKPRFTHSGLGLLGSLIKRIASRIPTPDPDTGDVDDVIADTSRDGEQGIAFADCFQRDNTNGGNGDVDCSSCLSPSRSPALSSPAISPSLPNLQEQENNDSPPVKSLLQEDEEHKQDNSPVSILDPSFEVDEYDEEEDGDNDDDDYDDEYYREKDEFDLEYRSYAFLQRARHHVLLKLQKFEESAKLHTIELEGGMEEDEQEDGDEYEHFLESKIGNGDDFSPTMLHEFEIMDDGFLACESGLMKDFTRPRIKRVEEGLCTSSSCDDDYDQLLVKRVCNQLDSWSEMASYTIEMMVGMDIQEESVKWTKQEQDDEIYQVVDEIECFIFQELVDELLDEFFFASSLINHHEIELHELNSREG